MPDTAATDKTAADRRYFTANPAQWTALNTLLTKPTPALPKLAALLANT